MSVPRALWGLELGALGFGMKITRLALLVAALRGYHLGEAEVCAGVEW